MKARGLAGPAAVVPQGAVTEVSSTVVDGAGRPRPPLDTAERSGGAPATLGQALARARDIARAFNEAPSPETRAQLIYAFDGLSRFAPRSDVNYDDILAIKELRKAVQAFARATEHADIAWAGCIVARYAEAFRDEPIAKTVDKEYSRAAGVRWKDYSDTYFGPTEARATYDVLRAEGIVPAPGEPFRFVSAAANSATQEAAMFDRDHETSPVRQGGLQFIVGDIAEIAHRALPGPAPESVFLHVRWNAGQLPLKPASTDIIWDRKGATWYALMHDFQNPNYNLGRSPLMALAVLRHYEEILKPGGSIVLDAIPRGLLPEVERSTPDAIATVSLESQIDVLALIKARFDVRFVGEGVTRCLVLTKRSA